MEISAWNPMNRTRRKKGPLAGLMTRVVTWRASPSSQFRCLRLYNRRRIFFSFNFSFYCFRGPLRLGWVSTRCNVVVSFFQFFFFFLHAPKFRTHARNQGPLIIIILLCLSFPTVFLSTGGCPSPTIIIGDGDDYTPPRYRFCRAAVSIY